MIALIYLGLAIALGDLVCRSFCRFASIAHRWAAAMLVGVLLSSWFTYGAGLACFRTAQPLFWADLVFFLVAAFAIFRLWRRTPKMPMSAPRVSRSSPLEWLAPAALFAAVCVLLIGTLYVNKQGRICLSGMDANAFASGAVIAQNFAWGHSFLTEYPHYAREPSLYRFIFFFQAGNLEFLGLNLACSIDVLSVLSLTSALALVMVLGDLLFNSLVVGQIGATLLLFHGSLWHLFNLLPFGNRHRNETWGFLKEVAFVNQRHLPFAIGVVLLLSIFLASYYRQRRSATAVEIDANDALEESNGVVSANPALRHGRSFVFLALLVAALSLGNVLVLTAIAVVLCCLLVAYGLWRLSRMKMAPMLGRVLAGAVIICVVVTGAIDLLAVYRSSPIEAKYEEQPLAPGLGFRHSLIYKSSQSSAALAREDLPKSPVSAFEGGRGQGSGQFDNPRGIATDNAGYIFVADTGNGRIEKFSPIGSFLSAIGTKGNGPGQFGEPTGLAIDQTGNIYVAETSNHRIQKLAPDGTFISEWKAGFYGPRRIAIGPETSIYVVDQGNARIVKFSSDGQVLATWGNGGSGDGQMKDPTCVAVDSINNRVYVADPINSRIQVFDLGGTFLTKWSIPEWGAPYGYEDLAIDPDCDRLYASSAHMKAILVFDLQGNKIGPLEQRKFGSFAQTRTDNPSGIALAKGKLFVLSSASARVSVIVLQDK